MTHSPFRHVAAAFPVLILAGLVRGDQDFHISTSPSTNVAGGSAGVSEDWGATANHVTMGEGSQASGVTGNWDAPPNASRADWLPFAGLAWLVLAVFLLCQAAQFQRWVARQDKEAPDPTGGQLVGIAVAGIMLCLWYARWFFLHAPRMSDIPQGDVLGWILRYFSLDAKDLALGLILASLTPTAIAVFTFGITSQLSRGMQPDGLVARSPLVAIWGVMCAGLHLVASIATLILFFK